jgi:hypothetical protein
MDEIGHKRSDLKLPLDKILKGCIIDSTGENKMENDPRVKIGRLVESWSWGHGRIVEIVQYFGFYVKFAQERHVYFPMFGSSIKYFNDEETAYLPPLT